MIGPHPATLQGGECKKRTLFEVEGHVAHHGLLQVHAGNACSIPATRAFIPAWALIMVYLEYTQVTLVAYTDLWRVSLAVARQLALQVQPLNCHIKSGGGCP
jgi:hypothetical protein